MKENITFLIIDDCKDMRSLLSDYINDFFTHEFKTNREIKIIQAVHGFDAIIKMGNQNFNYVITDKNMPIKDGKKMIEHAIKNKLIKSNQIMVLSGDIIKEDVEFFNVYKINNVLIKPFTEKDFYLKIYDLINFKS